MYHMCCAYIASLARRERFVIQSDACLTWVVGLLLIMRFNFRKWGRMTGRAVKMETRVATDGQGLYRVELHYSRIDRRRRHTLSHNLGLQSRLKCYLNCWIRTTLRPDYLRQFNRNTHKVTGHTEYGIRATVAPVDERRPERIVLDDADIHAPCYMTSLPYVVDSVFFKFRLQCPLQVMNSWIS